MKVYLCQRYYLILKAMLRDVKVPKAFFNLDAADQFAPQDAAVYEDDSTESTVKSLVGDELEDEVVFEFDKADKEQAQEQEEE